jgi:hypothetical protein
MTVIKSQMGGQNCNLDIKFEDGVIWLARIRLDDPLLPPKSIQTYLSLSEVATLRFLEGTKVPAPKVFYYSSDYGKGPIGMPVILMEKIKGTPLDWNNASASQRTKVLERLVDIFLELERYPFTLSGSLNSPKTKTVGAFAQLSLFRSPKSLIGPFKTIAESARVMVELQQGLINNGELSSFSVDYYLSHCWRLDLIPQLVSFCNEQPFFLKHFDDKGDHILVDNDFNITGIIDWEFASIEPKAHAFSTPCMLWPVGDFYSGSNNLSPAEIEFASIYERRGRKDMADIVRQGRKLQRFYFFNGGGIATDFEEFKSLFQGLRTAWANAEGDQFESYEDWKTQALRTYAGDKILRALQVPDN